jgi:23S rRNA (pseudouridine1915-N3)-methyltransferase
MRLVVLAVGTPRERHMAAMIREYETRAGRYFRLETIEVTAASNVRDSATDVQAREADSLRKRAPAGLEMWALTRDGKELSSRDLAESLSDMATYGHPGIVFVIGGAFGLDPDLVSGCSRSLSLSCMTMPHEMARLVLAEQIYRAGTILRGEPYHKGGPR